MSGDHTASYAACEELTGEQWALVEQLIPAPPRREDRRGRPWRDTREVLGAILWVLRHNAHWPDLPGGFPPYQTCHRRFQQWVADGTLRRVLEALEEDLRGRGRLDVTECLTGDELMIAEDDEEEAGEAWERSSWQRRTAMLLLSPATRRLLRRMRSPLAQRLSHRFLSLNGLYG